jgi:hypothetical protein
MQSSTRLLDTLCFGINISIASLLCIDCVVAIFTANTPHTFLGAVVCVIPSGWYAIAEWQCWYRKRLKLLRPLGMLNLALAALFTFGLVTNIGEALLVNKHVDPLFLLIFGLCFASIAGYLAWCGWRRIQAKPNIVDAIQVVR